MRYARTPVSETANTELDAALSEALRDDRRLALDFSSVGVEAIGLQCALATREQRRCGAKRPTPWVGTRRMGGVSSSDARKTPFVSTAPSVDEKMKRLPSGRNCGKR